MPAAKTKGPEISEIRALLTGRIQELARILAPDKPRIDGRRRWSLNPTRNDAAPDSFVIDITGPTAGRWYEFAGGFGGDVIDLISYICVTHGGGNYQSREARGKAIKWAIAWLGLGHTGKGQDDVLARARNAVAAAKERMAQEIHQSKKEREKKAARARKWWLSAALIDGTVGAHYFDHARKVPLDLLAAPPKALRFVKDYADPDTGELCPIVLSAMSRPGHPIRAVHMTLLREDGSAKANVTRPKRMFGDVKGCAIRLSKGLNKCSPEQAVRDGLSGETLAISEGIEDGLSWALMEPSDRVWAAGAVDLIGQVEIPSCISTVRLLAQNDADESIAAEAFQRQVVLLVQRYTDKIVIVERPPVGTKDWNDLWRAAA